MANAIEVENLVLRYGKNVALDGIDFTVPEGTVLGVLGPNGAGKTTAVRILATLLQATSGSARVFGLDVAKQANEVRGTIGLTGQFAAVDEYLTGYENLEMVGRLFGLRKAEARKRADELLSRFDLEYARDRTAKQYSGGMRRRLDIAASLIGRPRVVFLDEPTTGLDPRSRITMWEFIADLVRDGTTILLTTQYLEEADRLADSIIVLNKGKIIARGTADELKAQTGGERIEFVLTDRSQADRAKEILTPIGVEPPTLDEQVGRIVMPVNGGSKDLSTALSHLEAAGIGVVDVGLRRPNLDDVFLSLTGQTTGEPEAAEEEK
ncbi:daunorubicin resistance protein DrrA family ABC transporter ATP-binding protein [Rhodococcus sp. 05-2255-1e]|jgi:ABC-2 type transport system ATP-binding protein|uniref:daunorubicin resistance protein DrrA family ABC transporter ATP-binding protein n=1 Tax=Nocardiaceae TaxID=85025 RepID=UPI00050C3BC8|nr:MULTISPECIES: daunorubicin resistance protein DrrA family ABC transporter ATP-binding protein [Rhodococcus]AMY54333.1 Daunorubicin/doxorubicin resistance ATP-binding protein DrrA [Rhodococcus fascians D188]KJV04777.1 ABC transporter, ATP-binding component [Rhodococcus sp. PML026]MBW4778531.1 daunorubicin resistance protein DrrA family ABC transporter ATP-binding protein [Rhodococcus fascians]MBX5329916.1 daunorubicin resistance protein DrrA family ABC transporter ATP-binding protein [Rhodoco